MKRTPVESNHAKAITALEDEMRTWVGVGLSMVLLGCGILEPVVPAGEACGLVTCLAETYCADAEFETCKEGCRADLNCQDWQRCALPQGELVGVCEERPLDSEPDPPAFDNQGCLDACDSYQFFECEGDSAQDCYDICEEDSSQLIIGFTDCLSGPFCNYQECLEESP